MSAAAPQPTPIALPMKALSIPPYRRTAKGNYPTYLPTPDDQRHTAPQDLGGRLNVTIGAASVTFKVWADSTKTALKTLEKRTIHLDFEGTEFGNWSGALLDEDKAKGFYPESVTYKAWLQDAGQPADETKARQDWSIAQEAPDASNQSGAISSSIGYSLDLSGGFFGETPTANASAALNISSSHSHSLTDFTFFQHSDAQVLRHVIKMTQAGDGTPYNDYNDLVDRTITQLLYEHMRPLPPLAKSNVPVIGQAIWMNDNDVALVTQLDLHISIKARFAMAKAWNTFIPDPLPPFIPIPWAASTASWADVNMDDHILIDFGLL